MDRAARQHTTLPAAQQGAVILLLLLILAISTASYFLVKRLNGNALNIDRDKITAAALAQAKAALIGRAAADSNRPGELPCPDIDNDGKLDMNVDYSGNICTSLVGRLPWYTLGLPDLRDGYGEQLWYALSTDFHANGSNKLNTSVSGQLSITGTSPASAVIAIVFSPGPALGNQSRDDANINSVANYLEGHNANSYPIFETRSASDTFNDKLLPITYNDLFSVVTHRVASEIGQKLISYYYDLATLHTFPSALSSLPMPWLVDQDWPTVTPYATPTLPLPTQTVLVFNNCAGLTYTIYFENNSSKTTVSGHSC